MPDDMAGVVARLTQAVDLLRDYDVFECVGHREQFRPTRETWAWYRHIEVSDLRTLLAAYADAARDRERLRVDITKRADVACYEIRYLVPKVEVHAFSGHDFADVVGRAVADKWRETFDAARTGEAR